jgi:hypothetical protein
MQVPRGYVCNQVNDLLVAFRLLTDGQEDASVWLKPTRSSQGVILVTSANELKYYDFPLGEVIMQENLWNSNEDTKSDNQALSDLQISPCVQYSGNAILEGDVTALPPVLPHLAPYAGTSAFTAPVMSHPTGIV